MAFQFKADVVECILMWLPDFQSLASAVLVSKAIYHVYRTHSALIHYAVAENLLGPALPHAFRYIRCSRNRLEKRPIRWQEFLRENQMQINYSLSTNDIHSLVKIAAQTQALEEIFSWREKNHQFRTTRLCRRIIPLSTCFVQNVPIDLHSWDHRPPT